MNKNPLILSERTTVLLDAKQRERLVSLSERTGIHVSVLVRRALTQATDEELTGIILDMKEDPRVRRGALDQFMAIERDEP